MAKLADSNVIRGSDLHLANKPKPRMRCSSRFGTPILLILAVLKSDSIQGTRLVT